MGVPNHPAIRLGFSMKYTNQRAWGSPIYGNPQFVAGQVTRWMLGTSSLRRSKRTPPMEFHAWVSGWIFRTGKGTWTTLKMVILRGNSVFKPFFGYLMVFKTVFHPQFYGIPACYWNKTPKNGSIAAPVFLSQYCTVLQQSHIQS